VSAAKLMKVNWAGKPAHCVHKQTQKRFSLKRADRLETRNASAAHVLFAQNV